MVEEDFHPTPTGSHGYVTEKKVDRPHPSPSLGAPPLRLVCHGRDLGPHPATTHGPRRSRTRISSVHHDSLVVEKGPSSTFLLCVTSGHLRSCEVGCPWRHRFPYQNYHQTEPYEYFSDRGWATGHPNKPFCILSQSTNRNSHR